MLNATVVKRIEVTKDLIILGVRPDAGVPPFLPGQYVALGLPEIPGVGGVQGESGEGQREKMLKRAYSIGSSPENKDELEFYLAVVPDGALTPRLSSLKEGDKLWIANKVTGTFTLQGVPDSHNLVLVSTGTGIAPFLSMVRTAGTWTAGRKITVVHGVRYPSDLAYADELKRFAAARPDFRYFSIVSRAGEEWSGTRGRVNDLFERGEINLDPAFDHVFLCGNPAMIDTMQSLLTGRGYTEHSRRNPGNLHLEKYW